VIRSLAWRNIWRQPRRTILTVLGIALPVTVLVFNLALRTATDVAMQTNSLRAFDGFAQVQPKGYLKDPDFRKVIAQPEKLSIELRGIDGINAAAPRLTTFAVLANGARSYGASVIGVDPARERAVSTLAATVRAGRFLKASDSNAAVIGDGLARNLKLAVGDRVTLLGTAYDGSTAADVLRVVGIFHGGADSFDRETLEMPLARAQDTFGYGDRASIIAIAGPTLAGVEDALPAVSRLAARHGVVVENWQALEPSLYDSFVFDSLLLTMVYSAVVVVVVFIILNTLLMSVLERTREFGVILALGMRPQLLGLVVWLELLLLTLVGITLGIVVAGGLVLWLGHQGIAVPGNEKMLAQLGLPQRIYPAFTLLSTFAVPGAILLAVGVAGLVPYLHVQRLQAASAARGA
jgi:putative ABC transport system permease protein